MRFIPPLYNLFLRGFWMFFLRDLVCSFELLCPRRPTDPPACDLVRVLNFFAGRGLTFVVSSPSGRRCEGLVSLFFGVHSVCWGSPSHFSPCGFPGGYILPIYPSGVCRHMSGIAVPWARCPFFSGSPSICIAGSSVSFWCRLGVPSIHFHT